MFLCMLTITALCHWEGVIPSIIHKLNSFWRIRTKAFVITSIAMLSLCLIKDEAKIFCTQQDVNFGVINPDWHYNSFDCITFNIITEEQKSCFVRVEQAVMVVRDLRNFLHVINNESLCGKVLIRRCQLQIKRLV